MPSLAWSWTTTAPSKAVPRALYYKVIRMFRLFLFVLLALLIVLKLAGLIAISWWLVFVPAYILVALFALVIILAFLSSLG